MNGKKTTKKNTLPLSDNQKSKPIAKKQPTTSKTKGSDEKTLSKSQSVLKKS